MEIEQGGGIPILIPTYRAIVRNRSFTINLLSGHELEIDGEVHHFDFCSTDTNTYSLILQGETFLLHDIQFSDTPIQGSGGMNGDSRPRFELSIHGKSYHVEVDDHRSTLLKSYSKLSSQSVGTRIVRAPMPGLIARVEVELGQEVHVGTGLVVLEAMKMENEIRSLYHGKVFEVHVDKGKPVEKGEPLITIEEIA